MVTEIPLVAEIIIKELIAEITNTSHDLIKGLYLTGSISLNDFHPNKSDIDFIILSNKYFNDELGFQLEQIHRRIDRKFKKIKLNGCYITLTNLDINQSQSSRVFYYEDGIFSVSVFAMTPVTLYELKTTAITIIGTPGYQLPVTVDIRDVNEFLSKNINSYWKNWVIKHSSFTRRLWLLVLFPRLSEWVLLGVARQFYTLQTGKIASKTEAGIYCLQHLPDKYHRIMQLAIQIRNDKKIHLFRIKQSYYVKPSIKRAQETIACSNYLIQLFNEEYRIG